MHDLSAANAERRPAERKLATGSTVQRDYLRVRFLRGDSWEHGQLRYISNKSAKIASGALPRR